MQKKILTEKALRRDFWGELSEKGVDSDFLRRHLSNLVENL